MLNKIMVISCLNLILMAGQASATDHSSWDQLLKAYVNEKNQVNYDGLIRNKADTQKLHAYTDGLNNVPRATFDSWSKNDQKAFLINAYNALTVRLLVDYMSKNGPVESIKDTTGFFSNPWTKKWPFIKLLEGSIRTLDGIEHDTLRAKYPDFRIHAAVNCASVSCPVLRREAYTGSNLDPVLDEQMRIWMHDQSKNRYDKANKTVYLSMIFKWYKKDFSDGGGIKSIVSRFGPPAAGEVLAGEFETEYLDYDWNLNKQ